MTCLFLVLLLAVFVSLPFVLAGLLLRRAWREARDEAALEELAESVEDRSDQ